MSRGYVYHCDAVGCKNKTREEPHEFLANGWSRSQILTSHARLDVDLCEEHSVNALATVDLVTPSWVTR